MQCRPLGHQARGAERQITGQHRDPVHFQYSPVFAIPHLDVGRRMVIVIHCDAESIPSATLWCGQTGPTSLRSTSLLDGFRLSP